MRARRGLSEVLGALLLVVIMLGVASTIYAAHEQARRSTIESIREAERGLAVARSPPSVAVSESNGSVVATITSDIPLKLRLIIVRFAGGGTLVVSAPLSVEPYGEARVILYNGSCRPLRLVLVPESGPPLRYPEKGYYCDPASTSHADPWTGKPVTYLLAGQASMMKDPLFTANLNIEIRGDLMQAGPSRIRPLEVRVNGSYIGAITAGKSRVGGYKVGNATLEFQGFSFGDAYIVTIGLVPDSGQHWVWEGIATAELTFSASYSKPQEICTDSQTWLAPVPLGAITAGFTLNGTCTSRAVVFYSYEGSLNASSHFITGRRAILLVALNKAYAHVRLSADLQIRVYKVEAPVASVSIPVRGPIVSLRLERPLPSAGSRASVLDRVNANMTMLLDPLELRVAVRGPAGPVGSVWINQSGPSATIRTDEINLTLTVEAVQLLPPTGMAVLEVDYRTVFWNKTERRHELEGSLEETGRPQPWAFPAKLFLSNETELVIASAPPIRGLDPVDSVFPGPLELEANSNITVLGGWPDPYRYAAMPGSGPARSYGPSVTAGRLAEDFGRGILVYVYTVSGLAELPWGEEPVYAGQELWIN